MSAYFADGNNFDAGVRLLCLPHAGGGSALYHRWQSSLPKSIELVPICLPGREHRIREPLIDDAREIAGVVADEIQPQLDRPWAVLGHSLGAWIAFELARELRRRSQRQPLLFIAAASRAPDVVRPEPWLHTLPDDQFVAEVESRYQGIPRAALENAELLRSLAPILRADVTMIETYKYVDEAPLAVPILALGGTDDPAVSAAQLGEWRRHTTRKFSSRLLPGGHFFLFESRGDDSSIAATSRSSRERLSPALQMIVSRLEMLMTIERDRE